MTEDYEEYYQEYDPSDYQDYPENPCIHPSCESESEWEGWIKSGEMIRVATACDEHRDLLIGFQNENILRGAL